MSLVADSDELGDDASEVVLMTLHTAKGLDFPSCSWSEWKMACFRICVRLASPRSWKKNAALRMSV